MTGGKRPSISTSTVVGSTIDLRAAVLRPQCANDEDNSASLHCKKCKSVQKWIKKYGKFLGGRKLSSPKSCMIKSHTLS